MSKPARLRGIADVREQIRDGWREVWPRRWMRVGILQALVFRLSFTAYFTLGPVLALERLGGVGAWSSIVTGFGAGALAGGLLAGRVGTKRRLLAMEVGFLLIVPAPLLLGDTSSVVAIVAGAVLAGAGFAVVDVFWSSTLQSNIDKGKIGKVTAIDRIGQSGLRPLGYLFGGVAAGAAGVASVLNVIGFLFLLSVPVAVCLLAQETDALPRLKWST